MVCMSIKPMYYFFFNFHLFHENHELKSIKVSLKFPLERYCKALKYEVLQAYVMRSFIFFLFYDLAITDYFMIFANFLNSIGCIVGVDKTYLHAKFKFNISIKDRVMA